MILDGSKLTSLILKKVKEKGMLESEIRKEIRKKLKVGRHTLSNWENNLERFQKNGRPYNPTLDHLYELQWYFDLPNFKDLIRS